MPKEIAAYDDSNIFARILRGEIPAKVIFEDEDVLAFHDVSPAAPVHALVIPKGDYASFDAFAREASAEVLAHFWRVVQQVAKQLELREGGYRLITNHGTHAGQTVPHFHVHILGGRAMGKLVADQ